MTLKETRPGGWVIVYGDGAFFPRSRLARVFDCSGQAVERAFARAGIQPMEVQGRTDLQRGINTDDFPRLIDSIQRTFSGKRKLRPDSVDTCQKFRVETVRGIIFEYTYPFSVRKEK